MKNIFFYLLLCCFFLSGTIQIADAQCCQNAVIEVVVHNVKAGVVCSFDIPDKYLNKDGSLIHPIEVSLSNSSNKLVYSSQSNDLSINIPSGFSGMHYIEIRIADYSSTQKIIL